MTGAQQRSVSISCGMIDEFLVPVEECERRIDEYRARIRSQQEVIRERRAEAVNLRQELLETGRDCAAAIIL